LAEVVVAGALEGGRVRLDAALLGFQRLVQELRDLFVLHCTLLGPVASSEPTRLVLARAMPSGGPPGPVRRSARLFLSLDAVERAGERARVGAGRQSYRVIVTCRAACGSSVLRGRPARARAPESRGARARRALR